jgi:hypothetical protein
MILLIWALWTIGQQWRGLAMRIDKLAVHHQASFLPQLPSATIASRKANPRSVSA